MNISEIQKMTGVRFCNIQRPMQPNLAIKPASEAEELALRMVKTTSIILVQKAPYFA